MGVDRPDRTYPLLPRKQMAFEPQVVEVWKMIVLLISG